MGSIRAADRVVEFEDRVLAHLQVVIVNQFRDGKGVLLSWLNPAATGNGRSSWWLSPHESLHFTFAGSRSPQIDRAWVESLAEAARSGSGLIVRDPEGQLIRSDPPSSLRAR